ncbi:MAG: hypothetical protein IJ545_04705 [Alphaproteobacteria bacterium]|nr:hypothetical protein [Alphaproteobacteria bacterium]
MVATCTEDLDIINRALLYLGEKHVISVSDSTNAAEEMNAAYYMTRDELIRSYIWECCRKEDTAAYLGEESAVWTGDRKYVYQVPSDCLGFISFNDIYVGYSGTELVEERNPLWKIRGHKIYTTFKPPLKIEYKFRNEDASSYDALFCKVFALELAIVTAERIKQSDTAIQRLMQMKREALADALRAQAVELPAIKKPTGNWLHSRQTGF